MGFSGSVWFGFRMVENLRAFARAYGGDDCLPTDALVSDWHTNAAGGVEGSAFRRA
jgi:hypothetical protein